MLSVADIIEEVNITIAWNDEDKNILEKVFNKKFKWDKINLWRILSRKKQVVPLLNDYFN